MGGTALLAMYGGSPMRLLSAVFPEHNWLPWKFPKAPNNYFNNMSNKKMFLDRFNKSMDDWYNVSQKV